MSSWLILHRNVRANGSVHIDGRGFEAVNWPDRGNRIAVDRLLLVRCSGRYPDWVQMLLCTHCCIPSFEQRLSRRKILHVAEHGDTGCSYNAACRPRLVCGRARATWQVNGIASIGEAEQIRRLGGVRTELVKRHANRERECGIAHGRS